MKLVGVDVGGTFTDLVLFDTASPTVLSLPGRPA
jgi:N-methylhydantoinase A/oxoprolinase/acetone carboxylase beta subunit